MIDLHSHILPGLDDGPETLAGSLEIARAAVADGIRVVAATPHVRDDHPTDAAQMERAVEELRDALRSNMIPLDVRTGGEIAIDWLERLQEEELRRFGLGGNPNYILIECFSLLQRRLGLEAARMFQSEVVGVLQVRWVDEALHAAGLGGVGEDQAES